MPANLSTLNVATADVNTMLLALYKDWPEVTLYSTPLGWRAVAKDQWKDRCLWADSQRPVAALRKLCREVKKQEGKA